MSQSDRGERLYQPEVVIKLAGFKVGDLMKYLSQFTDTEGVVFAKVGPDGLIRALEALGFGVGAGRPVILVVEPTQSVVWRGDEQDRKPVRGVE